MTSVFDGVTSPERLHPMRPLAMAQKLLIYTILAYFVVRIGAMATVAIVPHPAMFGLYGLVYLATLILMLVAVVRLAGACGYSTVGRVLLLVAMFLPLVNLIVLLVLNARATKQLRDSGVKIGFMGADLSRM